MGSKKRDKNRRGPTKPRKRRDAAAEGRARQTQAAQHRAETKKVSVEQYRRRRVLGWTLVALGVVTGVQHLLSHWGLFNVISRGWDDLAVGYPMAALLGVAGAIVLSKA